MTPKMAYYSALAESAARDITSSRDQWTAFLTTSARLYKYPYSDQLMIFAQRPDATACAEYDLWNDKMRRYIKRGSKGIALVDNSGERPRLRYVFDVSDTGTRRDSRPVELWQMQEEHEPAIMEALSAAFDVSGERVGLDDLIYSAARKLAGEYWEDHSRQIFDIVADSYLEGYDEFNIGAAFRNAAATSIAYSVFSRSTVDADSYFEPENFLDIFDFNTQAASNVLGTAVTEMSGQIFREIERTIRNYERNRRAERSQNYDGTDLQTERRFSDSRNPAGGIRGETSGQVRQDEESIPAGEQFAPVQSSDTDRETVPSSVGDSGHRNDESRTADGSADAAESGTGQEDTADGMGG